MPIPGPVCGYCGSTSILVDASAVYGPSYEGRFCMWTCSRYPDCDAYVGVHANSPNAAPMGSLANPALRKLRRKAHELFDALWKSGGSMTRSKAYRELERIMGREKGKAHIAGFSEEQCLKLIMALEEPSDAREVA